MCLITVSVDSKHKEIFMKNKEVMSVSISPKLHEEVKNLAKRKDMKVSPCIAYIIDKFIDLNFEEEPIVLGDAIEGLPSIVIKVPTNLKDDKAAMKQYLTEQVEKACDELCK